MSEHVRQERPGVPGLAPEEEHLAGFTIDGQRRWIDPVVSPGRFLRARTVVGASLIALFVGLPHVDVGGQPAILLDLANRRFSFFGTTLHPTDNLILLAFGATVVISVFLFTTIFGRVWCGYGCPQTVYMELVFRPIETLVEGKAAERRRRDAGPWTSERVLRKSAKWAIYLLIALFVSRSFISYFVGWDHLWPIAGSLAEQRGATGATVVVTALMFVDFAFFREQMCTTACPYGRLQSVLFDKETLIIGYDARRGEPRTKGKAKVGAPAGDCIDCGRCVVTCPTGIDIRKGVQLECVGCAQCIDACDDVMVRIGKPRGLVRYASERELTEGKRRFLRPRTIVYLSILTAVLTGFAVSISTRAPAQISLFKGSNEPFRVLADGRIQNKLRLRVTNQTHDATEFTVTLTAPAAAELVVTKRPLTVGPDEVETTELTIRSPAHVFSGGRAEAHIHVRSSQGFEVDREMLLLGPVGG
ncbi:cytochrome c oxidase accessory protein CcoG [Myxococcota bacterium]|nr:cytochrome c oxidase accessory protein CcoG [Myxococcota bacterium]